MWDFVKHVTRQHALRALECPETKTSDIPNARVYGSQVVIIAAFDVNVLSSPVGGGSARNCWILPILPFPSSPGVVTAKETLRTETLLKMRSDLLLSAGGLRLLTLAVLWRECGLEGRGLSCTVRDGTEKVGV